MKNNLPSSAAKEKSKNSKIEDRLSIIVNLKEPLLCPNHDVPKNMCDEECAEVWELVGYDPQMGYQTNVTPQMEAIRKQYSKNEKTQPYQKPLKKTTSDAQN